MARDLYLHEVVDIVGQGAVPYMEHVAAFDSATADGGLSLVGTWYVMGSTGRWPQVVNLWQVVDGWRGWRRLADRTNLRRESNIALTEWWDEAYRRRSGGFDRLLGAVPGCPTPSELAQAGTKGTIFVHELTTVRPGSGADYLSAVRSEWAPIAAEYGHRLVGLWEVLLGDTEVCTIWATDLDHHIALMEASYDSVDSVDSVDSGDAGGSGDRRVAAWRERAREYTTCWHEELMVPCPGTLLGPPEWAE